MAEKKRHEGAGQLMPKNKSKITLDLFLVL